MDELIKSVVGKTGITEEAAKQAIDTVVEFLKSKLPAPLADQLNNLIGMVDENKDGNVSDDLLKKASGLLGGLFGGGDEKKQ
jgi:hypothetical protein